MNDATAAAPPQRSTFVNVVAWILICFSMMQMLVLISLLPNAMHTTSSPGVMQQSMYADRSTEDFPLHAMLMPPYFQVLVVLYLACCAFMLVSSIGLLLRKNWARLLFIILLLLGIALMLGLGVFLVSLLYPALYTGLLAAFNGSLGSAIFSILFMLLSFSISFLLAWIIKRLLSAPIRAEFG